MIREENQKVVRMDRDLFEQLVKWLETDDAKKKGYHSKAPFINTAVRELLEKYSKPRFEHSNFHDNVLRLSDTHQPEGTPFVEIFLKNHQLFCDSCQSKSCEHIKYSWQNPIIKHQLIENGIKHKPISN